MGRFLSHPAKAPWGSFLAPCLDPEGFGGLESRAEGTKEPLRREGGRNYLTTGFFHALALGV